MRHRFESGEVDDRPFWQQRGWQLSAVFVVLVVCAGLIAAFGAGSDSANDADRRAATGPLSAGVGRDGSRPGGCRTDDTDQSTPLRPPGDVTWRPLNGATIPLSASAGPLQTSGPVLWCFAHAPMGAVMAANVIPRQMSGSDWSAVTEQQVVPGIERDIFVAMRSSDQETLPQYSARSLAGFMLTFYSPDTATVRLLIRDSSSVYGVTDYTVAWNGGDWKVRPLGDGNLHTPLQVVTANGGFVMWKA
jgi:hypothetical protein